MYTWLGVLGAAMMAIGWVMLVITAFRTSLLWGLLVIFCPPVCPVLFAILHWRDTRRWALLYILGWLIGAPTLDKFRENYSAGRGITIDV